LYFDNIDQKIQNIYVAKTSYKCVNQKRTNT